jgi:single-strand DNA-binding protein
MVNKVILIGNLGRDPELRYTQSGTAVATLNLATSRRYKDRDGSWQEQTEWHRVVAWARTAEVVNEYASKGRQLYVEGRLQTRQWEDRDGNTKYTTEVIAENIQLLGPRGSGGGGGGYDDYGDPGYSGGSDSGSGGGGNDGPITDDDIPF